MTLNITVVTRRCIFQSADYRLIDWASGQPSDFSTQKCVLVGASNWNATVCFSGVGRAGSLDVSEWLSEHVGSLQLADPFERLIDELLQADRWLTSVPVTLRRHSFSVGAFVGSEPRFVLVSNYERVLTKPAAVAATALSVSEFRPVKPKTFLSGQAT